MKEPKIAVNLATSIPSSIAITVATIGVLVIGVFPSILVKFARSAIKGF